MPNVICHYGIKGMKWRKHKPKTKTKLKSVSPDDRKGMDSPTEGMNEWDKWAYNFMQSPFVPKEWSDYLGREFNDKQLPTSKDKPINQPRMYLDKAPRPPIGRPKPRGKEHSTNLPMKNRISSAAKKKVDAFIQGMFNKTFK